MFFAAHKAVQNDLLINIKIEIICDRSIVLKLCKSIYLIFKNESLQNKIWKELLMKKDIQYTWKICFPKSRNAKHFQIFHNNYYFI